MLRHGDIVADDYLLDSLIGKGGMGCVYRARLQDGPVDNDSLATSLRVPIDDEAASPPLRPATQFETDEIPSQTRSPRIVAIKELPPAVRLSSGQLVVQGVSSQMKLMRRVSHPGIARLLDAFRWNESFYLVFEYVEGRSLQSIVASEGAVDERQALRWAFQLCDILGYLHGLTPPVVYRDMKPSNVLVDAHGALKVVDLGIAREFKNAADQDKDTVAFGTQGYAPPEQYGCAQTDARSDIYALGCTLWHLVCGCVPPMEFPLPSARSANSQVSIECDEIISRCTQLDREKRYQSCAELADAIRQIIGEGNEGEDSPACEGLLACGGMPGTVLRRCSTATGPADRLANAFKQLLRPLSLWKSEKRTSERETASARPQKSSSWQRSGRCHRDNGQRHGVFCADRAFEKQPGPNTGGHCVAKHLTDIEDAASSKGVCAANSTASHFRIDELVRASGEDVAVHCFAHAPDLSPDDAPTTLLNGMLGVHRQETGELAALPAQERVAYEGDFFFTVVQSELCVHDGHGEPEQLTPRLEPPDAPRQLASRQSALERDLPQRVPRRVAPQQDMPRRVAPQQDAPRQDAPRQDAPRQDAPRQDAPWQDAPRQDASHDGLC